MPNLRKFMSDRSGSQSIEFSITILIFVTFLTGVAGLFTLYSIKSDLRKSVSEAERYALIHTETDSDLSTLVKSNLATYDPQNLTVSVQRAANGGIDYVKIRLIYSVDMVFGTYAITEDHSFPT